MTKLNEWLLTLTLLAGVWTAIITRTVTSDALENNRTVIFFSPIIAVAMFGIYSVIVIIYRVATFNDCEEAAEELQKQIVEARKDLREKGFNFDS